ncbi:DUF1571 domain-containing protein [Blastopirellula marina]|uniref:DUF1571 domain-containing protein n=1 Tax=Blastopirellula marina TaxID=124 RepID=A0A2S8G179_9BACT|nr:DUF1571 domain-containing protein [Blastopirellula marina]PQO38205.1 hypothetical protein C5Y98_09040 [Blastopirellula marina]PTL44861.1 DUF1571 domain-containing protein [Blastopirellula marina]
MTKSLLSRRALLMGGTALACGLTRATYGEDQRQGLREPVYRVSNRTSGTTQAQNVAAEHPLAPALRIAENGLENINKNVRDYECTLVKREQISGKLTDQEFIYTKVRHEQADPSGNQVNPFGVYMYFLKPSSVKGREVLYVKGNNNGNLMAHEGGALLKHVTVSLDPNGALAMRGNRYPITEVGIKNLIVRLIEVAKQDMQYGECDVKFFNGAKINGRVCTAIEVVHPVPRKNFRFHKAHIFIDDELQIPIRYASWDWPSQQGEEPPMLEEYTYMNMKLNNGFTDSDFDPANAKYGFNV